jgi:hypothetical protein
VVSKGIPASVSVVHVQGVHMVEKKRGGKGKVKDRAGLTAGAGGAGGARRRVRACPLLVARRAAVKDHQASVDAQRAHELFAFRGAALGASRGAHQGHARKHHSVG